MKLIATFFFSAVCAISCEAAEPDRSDIVQAKQWLNEPVQEILGEHIQSLMDFPPPPRKPPPSTSTS